jgi:Sulfotransferase domain
MTLPNFLVIGVAKAGTSSLHGYLRQHPDIFMPRMKDPGFFAFNNQADPHRFKVRSREAYEALFVDLRGETAIGEVSDTYFDSRVAPANIAAAIPDARIIVSLREPASRAFSLYHMMLRNRGVNEGLSFIEALERGQGLRQGYHESLAAWFDHFDRSRIRVLLFDDLTRNTLSTVRSLFDFLGVGPDFTPEVKVLNPGGVPKSKWMHRIMSHPRLRAWARDALPESWVYAAKDLRSRNLDKSKMTMSEEERARASAYFRDDILKTQDLVGVDLSRWLEPRGAAAA